MSPGTRHGSIELVRDLEEIAEQLALLLPDVVHSGALPDFDLFTSLIETLAQTRSGWFLLG